MGITVCIVGIEGNLLNGFIRLVNMLACLKCMLVDGYTVCHRLHVKNELSLILLMASVKCQFLVSYMTRSLLV